MPEKMSAAVLKRTNRIAQISTTPDIPYTYFRTLQLNSIQDPEWKRQFLSVQRFQKLMRNIVRKVLWPMEMRSSGPRRIQF